MSTQKQLRRNKIRPKVDDKESIPSVTSPNGENNVFSFSFVVKKDNPKQKKEE